MTIREYMQEHILVLDGAMGTMLQSMGYDAAPETVCLTHPRVVQSIHAAYYAAGSNLVCANTFGINRLRYGDRTPAMLKAAIDLALAAKGDAKDRYVALDIGPSGRLLRPFGDLDFEEAVSVFAQVVSLGAQMGVDAVFIETMADSYETKAALVAAKENCDLPVFVSNAYGQDGKLLTGATPSAMVAMLEGLGADAVGANCSFGPDGLAPVLQEMLSVASVPVLFKPNAGLPTPKGYDVDATSFAASMHRAVQAGVRMVGGCCGTTPDYIRATVDHLPAPKPLMPKCITMASSYTHALYFDRPVLVGERLNPTGKKRLQQALAQKEWDYVLDEAVRQQKAGAHALDVNVAVPGIDEPATMVEVLDALAGVVDVPLQLDSGDPKVLEAAMRRYNGKPIVNSVSGKADSIKAVFPLVSKYGGLVVALTLDEQGIPSTAEGRAAIAKRIVAEAAKYGIAPHQLLFDPLCLTVSADPQAATVTLATLEMLKAMGYRTMLGLSNVSYGLPSREALNATFLAMALSKGLTAAIVNPFATSLVNTYYAYGALAGLDPNCAQYVAHVAPESAPVACDGMDLRTAVLAGFKERAATLAKQQLSTKSPMDVIDQIISALDEIGRLYEAKHAFLPQLLLTAEAAKSAFACIDRQEATAKRCTFVLATVQGDIHDIGKNIVGLLLSNYGFHVVDLGKDVPPQEVVAAVKRTQAPLVGLSSLMTTTLPAMRETVRLLRSQTHAKVVVGGAVLTPAYAQEMGADCYAKDAMETVRYAEKVYADLGK